MFECPCEHEPQLEEEGTGNDGDDGVARLSGLTCFDFSRAGEQETGNRKLRFISSCVLCKQKTVFYL
jgi:hypothetical protein